MKISVVSILCVFCLSFFLNGCSFLLLTYEVTTDAISGAVWVVKGAYNLTAGTTKAVYKIGEYTYEAVKASPDSEMLNKNIESIDGLPPKDAIQADRVRSTPYAVRGRTYYPMSDEEAKHYSETGSAVCYGYEKKYENGRYMTANGEVFHPEGLTAAHRYLPLPVHVQVTNLENNRSIIVRVNDRGPFPFEKSFQTDTALIALSPGAAKKIGMDEKDQANVRVEAITLNKK
jgi:rare lipoprotein A